MTEHYASHHEFNIHFQRRHCQQCIVCHPVVYGHIIRSAHHLWPFHQGVLANLDSSSSENPREQQYTAPTLSPTCHLGSKLWLVIDFFIFTPDDFEAACAYGTELPLRQTIFWSTICAYWSTPSACMHSQEVMSNQGE